MIVIKENILRDEENKFKAENIQVTAESITTKNCNITTVTTLYSPPKHNIKSERYEEFFNTIGIRFIIGGDYNTKYTHWESN